MASAQGVLFCALPKRKHLRSAIARIIRAIQLENELSDADMAQEIGVSASTVRNARNEDADLNALTIANIGNRYGAEAVQPYFDLMGLQAMPKLARDVDPIPALANALHKASVARTNKERLDALPSYRIARDVLNHTITATEAMAA